MKHVEFTVSNKGTTVTANGKPLAKRRGKYGVAAALLAAGAGESSSTPARAEQFQREVLNLCKSGETLTSGEIKEWDDYQNTLFRMTNPPKPKKGQPEPPLVVPRLSIPRVFERLRGRRRV